MTTQPVDTATTLEIAAAPGKLLLLGLGGFAFTIAGVLMTQATDGTGRYSAVFVVIAGWAALIFFGACTILAFWRLATQLGTVVTLSPKGLRDVRVSPDTIAWPAIAGLSTWSHSGQNMIVVALKPGEEAKLKLTAIARMTRGANAGLGADGLAIAAQGLKIKHDALMAATIAFAERYGASAPQDLSAH